MKLSTNSRPPGTLCIWEAPVQSLVESARGSAWQLRGALGLLDMSCRRQAEKMLDFAVESDKPIDHVFDSAISNGRILAFMYSALVVIK